MWFAIDTLEYLRRGGRIGGARAWIGSALKIKPILTLEEEITPVERVRTRASSIERLRDYARQRHEDGFDAWVVQHIQDFETADALVDDCREIFGCEPAFVSEIGAVLGAHVGPGLLGVGWSRSRSSSRAGRYLRRRSVIRPPTAKPIDGGPDDQLRAVLADLAAPVGELGDLVRSCSTEWPRSWRWASMSARIWAGGAARQRRRSRRRGGSGWTRSFPAPGGRSVGAGGTADVASGTAARRGRRRSQRLLVAFDRRPDQLRLLDRLLGHRRGAGLDRACRRTSRRPPRPAGRSRPRRRSRPRSCRRPVR